MPMTMHPKRKATTEITYDGVTFLNALAAYDELEHIRKEIAEAQAMVEAGPADAFGTKHLVAGRLRRQRAALALIRRWAEAGDE